MAISLNEREKVCPECNASFACCIEKCWCAELPHIMTMTGKGDCFCPKCLEAIIQEKVEKTGDRKKLNFMSKDEMKESIDYYINENGNWVFTSEHHLKRGFCCKSGCKHCPYGFKKEKL